MGMETYDPSRRDVEDGGPVSVVAAVARRGPNFLVCRRPRHKRHGGLWEFPGGKVREGETLRDALAREVREELSVALLAAGDVLHREMDPGSEFEIIFIAVTIEGVPVAIEHTAISWKSVDELRSLDLAPADASFVGSKLVASDRPERGFAS